MSLRQQMSVPIEKNRQLPHHHYSVYVVPPDVAYDKPDCCWVRSVDEDFRVNAEDLARALLRAVGKEELMR